MSSITNQPLASAVRVALAALSLVAGACASGHWARIAGVARGGEPADQATPEALYHRRWALTMLERTLSELQADYISQGKGALFDALKPALGDDDGASAAELGAKLNMEPGTVRMAILRLRRRYRDRLLAEVATSMDARTEAEVEEEIAALFRALA